MGLWIIGAGGVGRESLDACIAAGLDVVGFLDDGRSGEVVRGRRVLAPRDAPQGGEYLVGIADPAARIRLAELMDDQGWRPRTVTHPRSTVAPETTVGTGSLLLANAYVSSNVSIGRHCQAHYNATIGHDAVVADFVTVYPGANISGSVRLHEGATVGSNAVVLQGRSVGRGAFVGAGAVVTRDVPDGVVVVGSPARRLQPRPGPSTQDEPSTG